MRVCHELMTHPLLIFLYNPNPQITNLFNPNPQITLHRLDIQDW